MTASSLAPLVVAVPLLTAAFLVFAHRFLPRRLADDVAIGAASAVTVGCAVLAVSTIDGLLVYWFGGWEPLPGGAALGIAFAIDPIGAGIATLAGALTTAALVFAWRYFDTVGSLFHVLTLTFLAGMVGTALTGDLFDLFVFSELAAVSAYALTGYRIEETGPIQGALGFAVTSSVGAFLLLFGTAMLYARTGALNFAQVGQALADTGADGLVVIAFTLITVAAFTKAAIVPWHFWHADAHAVAPTPICAIIAGVTVPLGVYVWARLYWTIFAEALAPHAAGIRAVVVVAGAVTALVGALMAYVQVQLKRMLAFSTVAHTGLAVIAVGVLNARGLGGAGIYIAAFGTAEAALFLCVGILLHRHGSVEEVSLKGRARGQRSTAVVTILGGLALAGAPPFGTALGKQLVEAAAVEAGYRWLVPLLVAVGGLTGGAVLRAAARIFFGIGTAERREEHVRHDPEDAELPETRRPTARTPLVMWLPAAALTVTCLALGFSGPVARTLTTAAERFTDTSLYANAVLHGVSEPSAGLSTAATSLGTSGVVTGTLSTVAGLLLALGGLYHDRLPSAVRRRARNAADRPLRALRAAHSGHIGDYVAWATVGVAVFGGAFAIVVVT